MEKVTTEKKYEIMSAAVALFSERGFDRTTVDEIAARANVGKGTIYLYFENKDQIFQAIIESGMAEIKSFLSEILASKAPFFERLTRLVEADLRFIEEHKDFYRIFVKERFSSKLFCDEASKERMKTFHQHTYQMTADFLKIGIENNLLRPGNPLQYAMALSGILSHFAFYWLAEADAGSLRQQAPVIIDLFLHGTSA